MPKAIYDMIYRDLKEKIETEQYAYQELLPSEHNLISLYGCSRNTVRRALAELASEGYIQSMQGKGVRNIYQPVDQNACAISTSLSIRMRIRSAGLSRLKKRPGAIGE